MAARTGKNLRQTGDVSGDLPIEWIGEEVRPESGRRGGEGRIVGERGHGGGIKARTLKRQTAKKVDHENET
jgi:hypothetical protein